MDELLYWLAIKVVRNHERMITEVVDTDILRQIVDENASVTRESIRMYEYSANHVKDSVMSLNYENKARIMCNLLRKKGLRFDHQYSFSGEECEL